MNSLQIKKLIRDSNDAIESFMRRSAKFCASSNKKKILIVIDPECKLGFDIRISLNGYSSVLSVVNFKSLDEAKKFEHDNKDDIAALVSLEEDTIQRASPSSVPVVKVSGNIETMQNEIVNAIGLIHA